MQRRQAGLAEKDVIIAVNGEPVETTADLQEKVSRYRPGDKVEVTYLRNGKQDKKTVVLRNIRGRYRRCCSGGTEHRHCIGATFAPVSSGEKQQFKIDNGVKITSISEGRFRDLGLARGTIIVDCERPESEQLLPMSRRATNDEKSLTSIEGLYTRRNLFQIPDKEVTVRLYIKISKSGSCQCNILMQLFRHSIFVY